MAFFEIHDVNKYSVASDTDSAFITLKPILQKLYPDLDLEDQAEVMKKIKPVQKELGGKLNKYQDVASKELFNCVDHFFDLTPEYIVKKAYWSGKRRYAQLLVDREGNAIEKFVMMGLDIMKSNFPPYFRKFGEKLIKDILLGVPKENLDRDVREFKDSIDIVEWEKLSNPSGLKKIDAYIKSPPKEGEVFSKLEKKCPRNTKAAIITNDLLRYYGLTKKYNEFTIGDKIKTITLKDNPFKIEVIGLNGFNDAPQILKIAGDYIDKDGLFDSIIRNKLETIYSDIGWELELNKHVNIFDRIEI